MDGWKFWCFPWFPGNSLLCVILRYTVYIVICKFSNAISSRFGLIVKGSWCQSIRRWTPHPTSYFLSIWPYWLVLHNVCWVLVFYSGNWKMSYFYTCTFRYISRWPIPKFERSILFASFFSKKFLYSFFLLLSKSDKIYIPKSKNHDHTDIILFVFQFKDFKLKSIKSW